MKKIFLGILLTLNIININKCHGHEFDLRLVRVPLEDDSIVRVPLEDDSRTSSSKYVNALNKCANTTGNTLKFAYNACDKLVTIKTLTALTLLGAPYFYFNPSALSFISQKITNMVANLSSAVASGFVMGLVKNPLALSKLVGILAAKKTGEEITKKIAEGIAIGTATWLGFKK